MYICRLVCGLQVVKMQQSEKIEEIYTILWYLKSQSLHLAWIPWSLSFCYIVLHEKRLQTMLWHRNASVNSHQRWKQTRFRVWLHLWCELTSTMNVTEWQVSWNSWYILTDHMLSRSVVTINANVMSSFVLTRYMSKKCYMFMGPLCCVCSRFG